MKESLRELFQRAKILISIEQEEKFKDYYKLLVEANKKINLTAIIEWKDVQEKHFLDSVIVTRFISFEKERNKRCIDIGTGAGFPGLPLAILFPNMDVSLLDSLSKRVEFLDHVVRKLEIHNVKVIHGRAEDMGRDVNYREKFDYAVSRAVANISTLSEYCVPFIKVGGKFLSYKSIELKEELERYPKVFSLLGCRINKAYDFILPGTEICRNIVEIEKMSPTDDRYPRKAGKPKRKPL